MFFRRVFSRKEPTEPITDGHLHLNSSNRTLALHQSPYRVHRKESGDEKQRSLSIIQLTPLWEHIIRTKSLPENINEKQMFDEFAERLHDPEWQVRQHALRVLVDVLIVMGPRSDQFFQPIICPLVENLGHSAPAVRKGALDVLKVYMTETEMPETIILEIISLGMEQKLFYEQFGGRLCAGVMLSLPSLVHTSLGTAKQSYILRAAIDAVTKKMVQVTYQEIALKVLVRIREMIGVREFSEYIAHGAYREFELLCNVYGLPSTPPAHRDPSIDLYLPQSSDSNRVWNPTSASSESNCKVKRTELCWRDANDYDEEQNNNKIGNHFYKNNNNNNKGCGHQSLLIRKSESCENERVIMETEIKIQDQAVTMRILEANSSENEIIGENSEDDLSSVYEHSGVVRVLTDSELDENNSSVANAENSGRDTARRVTFGGEEIKLRTPDSDSVVQSDNDDAIKTIQQTEQLINNNNPMNNSTDGKSDTVTRPNTASIVITTSTTPLIDANINSSNARHKSASPIKRSRRPSYSSADEAIASPKISHKGIEVLHNLQQRSPSVSPTRSRRSSSTDRIDEQTQTTTTTTAILTEIPSTSNVQLNDMILEEVSSPDSTDKTETKQQKDKKILWEHLGLVDDKCIQNIKSGVRLYHYM